MKHNMIIFKFEHRLTNATILANATLFSFEISKVSCLFLFDREKSTESLQMLEICWKFCCHIQFSFTTHQCPSIFLNQTNPEKNPTKNRFEDMELTVGRSYSMWNFLELIKKGVESTRVINRKATWYRRSFSCVTHFYGSTLGMIFDFSRISKTNLETLVECL